LQVHASVCNSCPIRTPNARLCRRTLLRATTSDLDVVGSLRSKILPWRRRDPHSASSIDEDPTMKHSIENKLISKLIRERGHAVGHVIPVPDNGGEYEFEVDGGLLTLAETRGLLELEDAQA
jgi:hypothetical protein